jgi:hypothetical protein
MAAGLGIVANARRVQRDYGATAVQAAAVSWTVICLWLLAPTALILVLLAVIPRTPPWAYGVGLLPFVVSFILMFVAGFAGNVERLLFGRGPRDIDMPWAYVRYAYRLLRR